LPSVLDNIARKLNLSNKALSVQTDIRSEDPAFFSSEWVVLARSPEALRRWTSDEAFDRRDDRKNLPPPNLRGSPKLAWNDEHASLLSAIRPDQGWPKLIYAVLIMLLFFGVFLGMIEIAFAMMARPAAKPTAAAPARK
jgi:hypothetical protein